MPTIGLVYGDFMFRQRRQLESSLQQNVFQHHSVFHLPLVLRQGDIHGFRATRMIQDKAQCEGNGQSFSSAATPY
jgi:hypothetical protein